MLQKKCSMIYIYIVVSVLTVVLIVVPDIYIQLGCFLILNIACLLSIKFDISHPYVWFVPLFTLYSIGYPLMYEKGFYAILPTCGRVEPEPVALLAHWCALCTFIITVTNKQAVYKKEYSYKINSFLIKLITISFILILSIQFLVVLESGFQTKREILDGLSSNLFFRFGKIANQLLPISGILLIVDKRIKSWEKFIWLSIIDILSFLQMLIIGERSAVIQIIVVELLAFNICIKKIDLKKAFIFGVLILLFIIAAVGMKASFGKSPDFNFILSEEPLWVKLFNAEFASASINTANILNHGRMWEFGYGLKYLLIVFLPFNFKPLSVIIKILGFQNLFSIADNATWYHDNILTGAKAGYGFSMVADGYMEMGILGVIFLYLLLGLITKMVYKRSSYSMLSLIFYITMIPLFIYSTRATFLYFVTYLVKYILIPIVLLGFFKVHKINKNEG